MTLVPLDVPPGAYRNGTEYQAKGRWRDVNLVRWHEGAMRPVNGLAAVRNGYSRTSSMPIPEYKARSAYAWSPTDGHPHIVWGEYNELWIRSSSSNALSPTPNTLTAPANADTIDGSWTFAHMADNVFACLRSEGVIYELADPFNSGDFTTLSGAPTGCLGVFVSGENFLFALGDGGDRKSLRWSDRGSKDTWTASATNQAGGYNLPTSGAIQQAIRLRNEFVIVTNTDVFRATYIGYPDVYRFDFIAASSSVGPHAGVEANGSAMWMGHDSFWIYDQGYVKEIACPVGDYIYSDLDRQYAWKTNCFHNPRYNEVWWLYQSSGSSTDVESYVAFNYENGTWHYGESTITAATPTPGDWASSGNREYHVVGYTSSQGDLVTNGDFASATGWTTTAGFAIGGGDATASSAGTLTQTLTGLTVGAPYCLYYQYATTGATSWSVDADTATRGVSAGDTSGAFTNRSISFVASSTSVDIVWTWTSGGTLDIDNVVVDVDPYVLFDDPEATIQFATPYAETGPLEISPGQERVHITRLLPDENSPSELSITLKTKEYPTSAEVTHGPYTAANPTSVRLSGRQFKVKIEATTAGTDWRSGTHRLEIRKGGKR